MIGCFPLFTRRYFVCPVSLNSFLDQFQFLFVLFAIICRLICTILVDLFGSIRMRIDVQFAWKKVIFVVLYKSFILETSKELLQVFIWLQMHLLEFAAVFYYNCSNPTFVAINQKV